ncbi:ATP synthase I [Pontibacillus litoralis JSM 072002]|uniref:ATP synthase I n=2 Tax=Pontibacillus TaxID=289201 RepID=A0A0A5G040_9BACI|nr:ATP synthase I [Pontibacillus litoralis JSM 072002]
MMKRQRRWTINLLAVFVLGWGFTSYQHIFLGLILGTVFSFYNLWLLQRKINHFGEAVSRQERVKTLGTLSRFAAGALAILIALRYDNHFHLIAVVIGLMTTYVVIMIEFMVSKFETSLRKRGE